MSNMKSMELTDDQSLDYPMPIKMAARPSFPYNLNICLTNAELEKLDIDPKEATVGGIFHFEALARITSISCNESEDGEHYRIEAQIESMGVIGGESESPRAKVKMLYSKD